MELALEKAFQVEGMTSAKALRWEPAWPVWEQQ